MGGAACFRYDDVVTIEANKSRSYIQHTRHCTNTCTEYHESLLQ